MNSISTLDEKDLLSKITKIVVFGIGGGGCNAINNMFEEQIGGVELIAANTDVKSLVKTKAHKKIQLGKQITRGQGSGSSPEVGRIATEESIEEIKEILKGTQLLFITTGMGGGTGTGGAPIVAKIAKQMDISIVAVITKPFDYESEIRVKYAEDGIIELQKYVDTMIVLPNNNLFKVANKETTLEEAFKISDKVLSSGVKGIATLIAQGGLITLDFNDVKMVIKKMGRAIMGTGEGTGEKRALNAVENALLNPLLENNVISSASGILVNILGGSDMTLFEFEEASNEIRKKIKIKNEIMKIGTAVVPELEGKIRVMVFAAGIDDEKIEKYAVVEKPIERVVEKHVSAKKLIEEPLEKPIERQPQLPIFINNNRVGNFSKKPISIEIEEEEENKEKVEEEDFGLFGRLFGKKEKIKEEKKNKDVIDDEELSIPAFLRNKK
ncbi:MAG: cell division protein FtsZ [Rickettsiales bacterium]|jgi:cell division protein FtsZ|nr:cell division protein FtsZ [Rickettsiales bacterium]